MTANAMPIQIDDPPSTLAVKANTRNVALLLSRLSNAVSTNGLALQEVVTHLESLRRAMDHHSVKVASMEERQNNYETNTTMEMLKIKSRIEDISTKCAWKADMTKSLNEVWVKVQKADEFIEEIEQGAGERVQRFIRLYIDSFMPSWWEGNREKLVADLDVRMIDLVEEVAKKADRRCTQSDRQSAATIAASKKELHEQNMVLTEERRRDLQKFREQTLDQFASSAEKLMMVKKDLSLQLLELEERATEKTKIVEDRATALRQTLCFEDGLCEELMDAAGGLDARCNLSVEEAVADVRVARIQRTPHFLHLRTTMQREINDRMEFLKSEVHQDLTVEMFDLQKELKGKVATGKMPELLAAHKDQSLYKNVRDLLGEATELKRNKLDSVLFVDALKSKADLKTLDQKVDRPTMNRTVGAVETRVDSMSDDLAALAHKFKQNQKELEDLQILVLTGRPPNREFPAISSVADILEGNVKSQVDSVLLQHGKKTVPTDVVIDGADSREVGTHMVPAKPPRGGSSSGGNRGGSANGLQGDGNGGMLRGRTGSLRMGTQVRGLTESVKRASSARGHPSSSKSLVSQHPQLSVTESASYSAGADGTPGTVGLTTSQQAYVELVGLAGDEPSSIPQQWKQHTGRPSTTGALKSTRTTSAGRGRGGGNANGRLGGGSQQQEQPGEEGDVEIEVKHPKYYTIRGETILPPPQPRDPSSINSVSTELPNIAGGGGGTPLQRRKSSPETDGNKEGAGMNALVYEGRTNKGGGDKHHKIALQGA